jgi:hypothetical protein
LKKENFERLESGAYGKLNMQYTYEILLENHDTFNGFLYSVAQKIMGQEISDISEYKLFSDACRDVLNSTFADEKYL